MSKQVIGWIWLGIFGTVLVAGLLLAIRPVVEWIIGLGG